MKLAVVQKVGWVDRWFVGLVDESDEARLLDEPDPTEPHQYEADEDLPTMATGPLCGICRAPEGHQLHQLEMIDDPGDPNEDRPREKITLEAPGIMVLLVGMGEHPTIAGQGAAFVRPVVQTLPYTRETVYLDAVISHAVEPLEPVDGLPVAHVVELYNLARGVAASEAAPPPRRRRIVTEN